jgi:hypothetical protein
MNTTPQVKPQLKELLLQSLEHERGGVEIYEAALKCAVHQDLTEESDKYLEQTQHHVQVLTEVCETLHLDPQEQTGLGGFLGSASHSLPQCAVGANQRT